MAGTNPYTTFVDVNTCNYATNSILAHFAGGDYQSTSELTISGHTSQCNMPCWAGYYCPSGFGDPVKCPSSSTSAAGSSDINGCSTCITGYYKLDVASCRICQAGYYCPNATSEIICPAGQYSLQGATVCTSCPVNTFSSSSGMSLCTACPLNSTSSVGSAAPTACNCTSGFYRDPSTLQCINCPANSFCPLGSSTPIACPQSQPPLPSRVPHRTVVHRGPGRLRGDPIHRG